MSLSTLGYFTGWLIGFLAAVTLLVVAKEAILLGGALAVTAIVIDLGSRFFRKDKRTVEVQAREVFEAPVIGVVA